MKIYAMIIDLLMLVSLMYSIIIGEVETNIISFLITLAFVLNILIIWSTI